MIKLSGMPELKILLSFVFLPFEPTVHKITCILWVVMRSKSTYTWR